MTFFYSRSTAKSNKQLSEKCFFLRECGSEQCGSVRSSVRFRVWLNGLKAGRGQTALHARCGTLRHAGCLAGFDGAVGPAGRWGCSVRVSAFPPPTSPSPSPLFPLPLSFPFPCLPSLFPTSGGDRTRGVVCLGRGQRPARPARPARATRLHHLQPRPMNNKNKTKTQF